EVLQFNIPILNAEFSLISPDNYKFEVKAYNGTPTILDTGIGNRNCHSVKAQDIAALDEEPFSDYAANLFKVYYRLSYANGENAKVRLFTWNDLAKQLYNEYYVYSVKEIRQVERYLKSI